MPGPLVVQVEPWGPDADAAERAVKAAVGGGERRVLAVRPLDGEERRVQATVYDYAAEEAVLLDVPLDGDGAPRAATSARQPLPSEAEREAALAVLAGDPELGPALRDGSLEPYHPMPPLLDEQREDGTVERTLTVGLHGEETNEIVGVRMAAGEIVRFDGGAPPNARAAPQRCGMRDAQQQTVSGRPGAARITVTRDGQTLWRLIAIRPAASSGGEGSAVELRDVAYRGKRVLRRAHVPILNVRYDGNACGPYRDWQNEESRFQAHGDAVAPGFRLCPQPAKTILDPGGRDRGNFAGVAVYVDGEEAVLVSELEAGWYRYVSRWRLHADGTIRPRFGFGAVRNSCVCETHHHHAYWRLDFDIAGAGDDRVREHNDPPLPGRDDAWHTLRHEIRRGTAPNRKRRWLVENRASGEGYTLVPGPNDGERDDYGLGDLWALRYRSGQIDDNYNGGNTRARLDQFVNRESIVGTNVVLWYAAHFSHVPGHAPAHGQEHIVGPTLKPQSW